MIRRLSDDLQIEVTPALLILAVAAGILACVVGWLLVVVFVGIAGTR